ncbi:hypothetical protein L218DRAFT_963006 [Marasmius fiardii PR-910]|nr:hypothetical protein L218DRAFT_963006 [Marasmius fiardii PR-910]
MLVAHPSSSCDVCLESFRFEPDKRLSGDQRHRPHVLSACGHVFCKGCLDSIARGNRKCPLCRCYFSGSDVKKLHVEVLKEDLADALLRSLYESLNSGSKEHLSGLIVQAEGFLRDKEKHECLALRLALQFAQRTLYERGDMLFRAPMSMRKIFSSRTRVETSQPKQNEEYVSALYVKPGWLLLPGLIGYVIMLWIVESDPYLKDYS